MAERYPNSRPIRWVGVVIGVLLSLDQYVQQSRTSIVILLAPCKIYFELRELTFQNYS